MTSGFPEVSYGGFPVVERRALSWDERREVERWLRSLRWAMVRTYGTFAALEVAVVLAQWFELAPFFRALPLALLLILVLYSSNQRFLGRAPLFSLYGQLRLDANCGIVYVCRGPTEEPVIPAYSPGGRVELPVPLGHEEVTLEILPESATIWTFNDRRTWAPLIIAELRAAKPPQHAQMAANFVKPVKLKGFHTHQRALTEEEHAELRFYIPEVRFAEMAYVFLLLVAGALFTAIAFRQADLTLFVGGAGLLLLGIKCLFWALKKLRIARTLREDAEWNFVLIVREELNGELAPPREFLGHTRWLWTEGGSPAGWRKERVKF